MGRLQTSLQSQSFPLALQFNLKPVPSPIALLSAPEVSLRSFKDHQKKPHPPQALLAPQIVQDHYFPQALNTMSPQTQK